MTSHRPQVIWNKKVFIPRLMAHYNLLALYRPGGQEEKEKKKGRNYNYNKSNQIKYIPCSSKKIKFHIHLVKYLPFCV